MSTATTDAPTIDLVVLEDMLAYDLVCIVDTCENVPDWSVTWTCGHVALYCHHCWYRLQIGMLRGIRVYCDTHNCQNMQAVKVVPL